MSMIERETRASPTATSPRAARPNPGSTTAHRASALRFPSPPSAPCLAVTNNGVSTPSNSPSNSSAPTFSKSNRNSSTSHCAACASAPSATNPRNASIPAGTPTTNGLTDSSKFFDETC